MCFADFVGRTLLACLPYASSFPLIAPFRFLPPLPNCFVRVCLPTLFAAVLKIFLPLRTYAIFGAANSNSCFQREQSKLALKFRHVMSFHALQVSFEQIYYVFAKKPDKFFWTREKPKTFAFAENDRNTWRIVRFRVFIVQGL